MTTSAQRGHIGFAIQPSKIGSGAYDPTTLTWMRHRAVSADFAVIDSIGALPLETGGGLFTEGTYKNGAWLQGSLAMEPRLKDSFGHLLYGVSGAYALTAAGGGLSKKHTFKVSATNDSQLPWLSMRKYTPDTAGTGGITEYGVDCRVAGMRLVMPQTGTMKAEVAFQARRPIAKDTEDTTGNTYEGAESLALSCQATSSIELTDFAAYLPGAMATGGKFTGAEIILANQLSQPQQEMIIGSYHPDDFIALARAATINLVYKWEDPDLYTYLLYASAVSTQRAWQTSIRRSAVKIVASAADVVPTFTNNYKLEFEAANVDWSMSPVTLAGGQMVMVQLTGQVTQAPSGSTYNVNLWNAATYTGFAS